MSTKDGEFWLQSSYVRRILAALKSGAEKADRDTILFLIDQAMLDIMREEDFH